ncbi:MAG: ATP-binding protein, partial [Bacteroidales bacterium]|nr:ATP-binding protein [Bacteroidales bacterium]
SQTKSKWFGESEKLVKQIFTDYKTLLLNSPSEPILFINEADGLFGRRMDCGTDSSSADQTVNTVQNILLQELEDFEGILIAATNLPGSLDKAFERRFSFMIKFTKPDAGCRQRIWKNKLPELSAKEAESQAARFELTGGDIDVKVRKVLLKKALDNKALLSDILEESCTDDIGLTARRIIPGFRHSDRSV